jgi:hypothetical protein
MAEPIEYQTPLPAGYRLCYVVGDDGLRISRESPSKTLLWSEACVPIVLLVGAFLLLILIRQLPNRLNLPPVRARITLDVGYVVLVAWVFVNGRRAWQNMGIVTEIAVAGQSLYWRKQNLWGTKEYFWPLSSIKRIGVQNRLLKVYRRRGPALAAFSFVKPEERDYASRLLNNTIARQQKR